MTKTAKKKKTIRCKRTKITPAVAPSGSVNFSCLRVGEGFLMSGSLWMKVGGSYNQAAFNLIDGSSERSLCGRLVVPVKIEIKWEKL